MCYLSVEQLTLEAHRWEESKSLLETTISHYIKYRNKFKTQIWHINISPMTIKPEV